MHYQTIETLSHALHNKKCSATEITQDYLNQIKQYDSDINSMITLTETLALEQAAAADQRIQKQQATPLTGIPIIHKDIFCTRNIRTTCASKMLETFVPPYNATVVEHLNAAGMITLGKSNMDEFAMGSSNEFSYFGPVKNPWKKSHVPGGSSGGSAAAVAAQFTPAATGTDTGGSIRQPAALCGITGIKPTYGRISRYGMIAYASSLDQAGPMTHTAADAALLLEYMSGYDPKDATSLKDAVPHYHNQLNQSVKGLTVGLPKEFFNDTLEPSIQKAMEEALKSLQSLGVKIKNTSLPYLDYSSAAYYVIASAECSSNLSRYDGVHYGYRCEDPTSLDDLFIRTRTEGFGEEVKQRILTGTYALSAGYYDAFYKKAQCIRQLIRDDFTNAFNDVDVILSPTSPSPAFALNEKVTDPIKMYQNDIFTLSSNLAGLPALSMPMGFHEGLPLGLQLIGKPLDESLILNLAHQYQTVTDWHKQAPKLRAN